MAIVVNTNLSALKTQMNLNMAANSLSTSLERMSTGLKINSAKDDAAGMFVATGLNKTVRGSQVAQSNIQTGTNVLQMVEGDFDVIMENLNRIRDLTVQAANSVYDDASLTAIQNEVSLRLDEIDRIAAASNFNGMKLLDGTSQIGTSGIRIQAGANSDSAANSITIESAIFSPVTSDELGKKSVAAASGATGLEPASGTSIDGDESLKGNLSYAYVKATAAAAYITIIDNAINTIAARKSKIGTTMARLESASISLQTTLENSTAAKSTIMDADIAQESANYTRSQILQQTSASLLVQANALPSLALSLISG